MAFTALKQMQVRNQKLFEAEALPHQPERHYNTIDYSLKAMALRFLHTRCEDLLFDDVITSKEQAEGKYYGTSLRPGQIPYNMQMDVNRLCMELEQAIGIDKINDKHIDSLTAILMHNSLFKFAISFYKDDDAKGPLKMDKHPLAYLLMLCDELQCWDRIPRRGRKS